MGASEYIEQGEGQLPKTSSEAEDKESGSEGSTWEEVSLAISTLEDSTSTATLILLEIRERMGTGVKAKDKDKIMRRREKTRIDIYYNII